MDSSPSSLSLFLSLRLPVAKHIPVTSPARHPYIRATVSLSRIAQADYCFCRCPFQSIVAFGNDGHLCSFPIRRELEQETWQP